MTRNGLLLVDKPEGPSSAEIVSRVKAALGAKKIGHLGTLDPFASGLLPLGINEGTKIAGLFLGARKSYAGSIALGIETDSQDSTGRVLRTADVRPIDDRDLDVLRQKFSGTLWQTPPMFSALKKSGERLYRLARRGAVVERAPRQVEIEQLRLWQAVPGEIRFEVTCSKGTYVRALAADIGSFLGCGAHLKSLRRLACGHLILAQAVPLDFIESAKDQAKLPILSLDQALSHLGSIGLSEAQAAQVRRGQQELLRPFEPPPEGETLARLIDQRGEVVAIVQWAQPTGWRLMRVFPEQS
jgi:tRNA pseudouridine55 synthase